MNVRLFAAASLVGLSFGCQSQMPVNVRPDYDSVSQEMTLALSESEVPRAVSVPIPAPTFTPEDPPINCPKFPLTTYWLAGHWDFNGTRWLWARGYCYRGEDPTGASGGPYLLYTKDTREVRLNYRAPRYTVRSYRRPFWQLDPRSLETAKPPAPPAPPAPVAPTPSPDSAVPAASSPAPDSAAPAPAPAPAPASM